MKLHEDKLIVLTGGAGFIGSCVLRYLNDLKMTNIIVVDELGKGERWKNLVGKQFFDILDKGQLFKWLEGRESDIEAFIHLGACSDTTEIDASFLLENNYQYTQKLAEYALKHEHRFIYASSAATYGDGSQGFSDDHDLLETFRPLNMYGYSKHLFDLWAKQQGVLDRIVGIKYFNVFGPNEAHKGRMASAIVNMVSKGLSEGVIRLFKSTEPEKFPDGGQCRDFIYVKDAVRLTCSFLEKDAGGIFNIGSGIANTWKALAEAVIKALDKPIRIEYIEMPSDLVGKYQNYTCATMEKCAEVMPVKCMKLENAVADYVRNHILKGQLW